LEEIVVKDYSAYSMEDLYKALNDYYASLTVGKYPAENPKAYLLGGQGGSGKSTIHRLVAQSEPNTIVIDGDVFRDKHPNYEIIQKLYKMNAANYTQAFSNNIVSALIEKLSSEKYNIIVEGTCRRAEVPLKTCNDLKEKGYHVELAVMCVDKDIAWQSTIDRYNTMKALGFTPRAVPFDKYTETVNALPKNIETLYESKAFDDIKLYNRDGECLYKYSEQPTVNPRPILESILYNVKEENKGIAKSEECADSELKDNAEDFELEM
jgi:UDP-N-acetylglucosamine kinase